MTTTHVATINAFPNKFGGWTGAIRNEITKEIKRERFETRDEARYWVQRAAFEIFGEVKYACVARKGEYLANCWQ
jgi:hypothetical protein